MILCGLSRDGAADGRSVGPWEALEGELVGARSCLRRLVGLGKSATYWLKLDAAPSSPFLLLRPTIPEQPHHFLASPTISSHFSPSHSQSDRRKVCQYEKDANFHTLCLTSICPWKIGMIIGNILSFAEDGMMFAKGWSQSRLSSRVSKWRCMFTDVSGLSTCFWRNSIKQSLDFRLVWFLRRKMLTRLIQSSCCFELLQCFASYLLCLLWAEIQQSLVLQMLIQTRSRSISHLIFDIYLIFDIWYLIFDIWYLIFWCFCSCWYKCDPISLILLLLDCQHTISTSWISLVQILGGNVSGCLICCYFTEGSSSWLDQPKLGTMKQKSDVQVQKAEKIHTVHRGVNFSEAKEFQRAEKIQKAEKIQISEASLRMFVFDLRMPAGSGVLFCDSFEQRQQYQKAGCCVIWMGMWDVGWKSQTSICLFSRSMPTLVIVLTVLNSKPCRLY